MSTTAPLAWTYQPTTNPYYINTVATSANGERVITGTYYYDYSQVRRPTSAGNTGVFGTYCLDSRGNLLWKDEFTGYAGVYWTAITPGYDVAASCGEYTSTAGFVFIYDVASGTRLVSFTGASGRVSNVQIATSGDAVVAGGHAVYSFARGSGGYASTPLTIPLPIIKPGDTDSVQGLAVDVTGSLIAVGTVQGNIFLIETSAGVGNIIAQYHCGMSVHSIAMNWVGSRFVAGASGGQVYYFDIDQFIQSNQPTWTQTLPGAASVYGVAINMEGDLATAVGNVGDGGVLGLLVIGETGGVWAWTTSTEHNPNSTSMSGDGGLITVADGHPDGTPGAFYLYSAGTTTPIWVCPSGNMSWPMQICSSGIAAVAGSDDGLVYYFAPTRVFDAPA